MTGRIIAFDYGARRTGIAVTDPMCIIATALQTVPTADLLAFVKKYLSENTVKLFVLGKPLRLSGEASENLARTEAFAWLLQKNFPQIPIVWVDERYSSKMALDAMIASGTSKKQRQK